MLGEPEKLRRLTELLDVTVGPGGGAGEVGSRAAETGVGSGGQDGWGISTQVVSVFRKLVFIDIWFVADAEAVDLGGMVVHEILRSVGDFGDGGLAQAEGVDDLRVSGPGELEKLVDLRFGGDRNRGSVGGVATDAKAADAKGVEELDEGTVRGDEVGRRATRLREKGEGLEAVAEEVRWDGRGGSSGVEVEACLSKSCLGSEESEENGGDADEWGEADGGLIHAFEL